MSDNSNFERVSQEAISRLTAAGFTRVHQQWLAARDWWGVIAFAAPGKYWECFDLLQSLMTDSEYAATVRQIWVQTNGLPPAQAEQRLMLHGRQIPREMWMTNEDRVRFEDLPDTVTVYRGCQTGLERGWSWSLTHRDAERFAKDILVVGTVAKVDIFALFSAVWTESEVIIPGDRVTITSVEHTRDWNRPDEMIDGSPPLR